MDDFHFEVFRTYVKNRSKRSYYPLALIDVISRDARVAQDSEELYRKTYGETAPDERAMKKLFQLAHYTFRLTSFLAVNYPDYLQHNVTRVQHFFNTGQPEEAANLLSMALEIAEKIEDHDTELKLRSISMQKEVLQESARQARPHHERIAQLLGWKQDLNNLLLHLHNYFNAKGKPEQDMQLQPHLDFFSQYFEHEVFALRIISRFGACYARYYVKSRSFYSKGTLQELQAIERELQNNPHILLPYLFTLNHRVSLLKLNYSMHELGQEDMLQEAEHIMEESQDVQFWNSFINLPEIFSIAVQTSHYLSRHMTSYRKDHLELLPEPARQAIDNLKQKCLPYLENAAIQEDFTLRYINLSYMYAGLLILGEEKEIRAGIDRINSLLLSFQQVPFHTVIDSIYTILVLGHFALQEHEKVTDSYNRYRKATRGKSVNPENDLTINGFYYLSRWVDTGRKQYIKKFTKVLDEADKPNLKETKKLLMEAAAYFSAPVDL